MDDRPTPVFVRGSGPSQRPFIARRRTGADGIAQLVMTKKSLERGQKGDLVRVAINSLLVPGVSATFPPDEIPEDVVDLTLPSVGSIEVIVNGIDGKPCKEPIVLMVFQKSESALHRRVDFGAKYSHTLLNGRLTLPYVSCGLEFSVYARGEQGSALKAITAEVVGPKSPGEIAVVTLQFTEEFYRYTCRLVNSAGAPLANEFVAIRPAYDSRPRLRGVYIPRPMTDEQGRVFGVIDPRFAPDRTVSSRNILFAIRARGVFPEMVATIELPIQPIDRSIDFGTVVLDSQDLLIKGRAVDADGKPIEFARLYLEPAKNSTEKKRAQSWNSRSDRRGRFAVYGDFHGSDLSLRVDAHGFGKKVVAVTREDDIGDVVLQKLGGMKG